MGGSASQADPLWQLTRGGTLRRWNSPTAFVDELRAAFSAAAEAEALACNTALNQ
jgi:hypothetical protein